MKKIISLIAICIMLCSCNTYYIVIEDYDTDKDKTNEAHTQRVYNDMTKEANKAAKETNIHFQKQIEVIENMDGVREAVKAIQYDSI